MHDVIQTHYRRLAESYDNFLYYSPDFVRSLTANMIEALDLGEDDAFVDLGCGTGMYAIDILEQVPLRNAVVGVDPFPEMLGQIPDEAPIEKVCQDALTFSIEPITYDKVLMKEAIHHIDQRQELFANLHKRLSPNGRLLLVHVPPNVQYPLFKGALQRCKHWHADPNELVDLLKHAGYEVRREAFEYLHSIPKDHYFGMVAGRYMSVLSTFTDEELAEGLGEMERAHADQSTLTFVDRFDFITAQKS